MRCKEFFSSSSRGHQGWSGNFSQTPRKHRILPGKRTRNLKSALQKENNPPTSKFFWSVISTSGRLSIFIDHVQLSSGIVKFTLRIPYLNVFWCWQADKSLLMAVAVWLGWLHVKAIKKSTQQGCRAQFGCIPVSLFHTARLSFWRCVVRHDQQFLQDSKRTQNYSYMCATAGERRGYAAGSRVSSYSGLRLGSWSLEGTCKVKSIWFGVISWHNCPLRLVRPISRHLSRFHFVPSRIHQSSWLPCPTPFGHSAVGQGILGSNWGTN